VPKTPDNVAGKDADFEKDAKRSGYVSGYGTTIIIHPTQGKCGEATYTQMYKMPPSTLNVPCAAVRKSAQENRRLRKEQCSFMYPRQAAKTERPGNQWSGRSSLSNLSVRIGFPSRGLALTKSDDPPVSLPQFKIRWE
jgi:hypothetical protein